MSLHILFESASGYVLLQRSEGEDIAQFHDSVQKSVLDFGRFSRLLHLTAFQPFLSAENALENINCISEGAIHETLRQFLELNLPLKSKQKLTLGVCDAKLATAIHELWGSVAVVYDDKIQEVMRGVRLHLDSFVKDLKEGMVKIAQLGLAHSYSRSKVKFNVNRADNMIIQSINLLDKLDKDINTFSMRVREWYSWHFPELVKLVNDNYMFARLVKFLGVKSQFTEDKMEALEKLVEDPILAKQIFDAARSSMGMDLAELDMHNIEHFASRVISLAEYRKTLMEYLTKRMHDVAPNLATLIGEVVGARLIAHAGSLTSLAKYPASTVQILGAEKALFRALKARQNTPKYGLIFHSSFIGRAATANKGRISRYLANKCSIASRIDCFSETPSTVFGQKLHEQVEERLHFYDSGETPRKNIDVMQEAAKKQAEHVKATENGAEDGKKEKKKEKKDKKKDSKPSSAPSTPTQKPVAAPVSAATEKKKDKKKSKKEESDSESEVEEKKSKKEKKEKKEKKRSAEAEETPAKKVKSSESADKSEKKKKKSKD